MPQADAYSTTSTPGNNLQPLVDELGYLRADSAALEMRESALKDQIVALGEGRRDFRVNVSISSRSNLDLAAVRAILSDAVVEKLTRVSYVTTVRVTARSRIAA